MNHVLTPEQAAAFNAVRNPFSFDLLEFTENIDNERIKDSMLRRLAFSCDGHIIASLGKMLNEFYKNDRIENTPKFETYSDMLRFVEGLNNNEVNLEEQGFEVTNTRQRITALVDMRETLWAIIAKGDKSKIPMLVDTIKNPRLRTTSKETLAKNQIVLDALAGDDKELRELIAKDFEVKDKMQALQNLEFDKNRAEALITLFDSLNIDIDSQQDDPFGNLDAPTQAKLLDAAMRAVDAAIDDGRRDNRVTGIELATMLVDAKPMKAELQRQRKHGRFIEL